MSRVPELVSLSDTLLSIAPGPPGDIVGSVLDGRYRLTRRLGVGGMGVVYEAERVVPGTQRTAGGDKLAVKVLRSTLANSQAAIDRLRLEARAASAIGDPHIVDVFDCGPLESGGAYVVMERLDGIDLFEALGGEAMDWVRVCHVGAQIACALNSAHAEGVLHRDLKPENVYLIEKDGVGDFVKILDFGIAKLQDADERLTLAGEVVGTPEYMSPEQCSAGPIDHRADIYSFGVLLFEMLTGTVPFQSEDLREICLLHMQEPAPSIALFSEGFPQELIDLVGQCLEKRPSDRPPTMTVVAATLRSISRGDTVKMPAADLEPDAELEASPEMPLEIERPEPRVVTSVPPVAPPRRLTWALASAAALTVLLVGVLAWSLARPASHAIAPTPAATPIASAPVASAPVASAPVASAPVASAPVASAPVASAPDAPAVVLEAEAPRPIEVAETLQLTSSPEGAQVRDASGGVLGRTPITLERPSEGRRAYVLELAGYTEREIVVSSLSRGTLEVPLSREVEAPVAARDPAPAARRGRARRGAPEAEVEAPPTPEPSVVAGRGEEVRTTEEASPEAVTDRNAFLDPWDS